MKEFDTNLPDIDSDDYYVEDLFKNPERKLYEHEPADDEAAANTDKHFSKFVLSFATEPTDNLERHLPESDVIDK
jgi:hypothetical protein